MFIKKIARSQIKIRIEGMRTLAKAALISGQTIIRLPKFHQTIPSKPTMILIINLCPIETSKTANNTRINKERAILKIPKPLIKFPVLLSLTIKITIFNVKRPSCSSSSIITIYCTTKIGTIN